MALAVLPSRAPELRSGGRAKLLTVPPDRLSELVRRRSSAQFLVEAASFLPPRPSRSALDRRRAPLGPLSPSASSAFSRQAHCLLLFLSPEILYLPLMTSLRPGRAQGEQPRALSPSLAKPSLRVQRNAQGAPSGSGKAGAPESFGSRASTKLSVRG